MRSSSALEHSLFEIAAIRKLIVAPRYMTDHAINLAMKATGLLVSIALIVYARYENQPAKVGRSGFPIAGIGS